MALTVRGRIYKVLPVCSKERNGKTYLNRDVVLDCSTFDPYTGEGRDNFPSFNFYGNKCDELNNYNQGDTVEITYNLNGSRYPDKVTKEERYYTKLSAFKIDRIGQNQPTQPYPPQDYQPQGMHSQAPIPQPGSDFEKDDDLPF